MSDRLERLLNLVIALRETRRPLTAAEVRQRVAGYGQDDPESFRRMFERDKADLRDLGVPVEVAVDRFDDTAAYRIDPRRYDLPPVRLEPDELAALAVALAATGLRDDARVGLGKLAVDAGADVDDTAAAGLGVDLDSPHRSELLEAVLSRTAVRFAYRPLGRDAAPRTVDPFGLVHRTGRWYLVGRDHDRDDRRSFRLDRIEGRVRTAGPPGGFAAPAEPVAVDQVVPAPRAQGPATARVAADADVAWLVARRARGGGEPLADGRTAYRVAVGDPERFTSWVLEHAGGVEVLDPAPLREGVVAAAREALAAAGAAHPTRPTRPARPTRPGG